MVTIVSERENKLMERKELVFEEESEKATPSREELRKKLAASTGAKEELIVVQKINQKFGEKRSVCTANIYSTKEALEKNELKHVKNKNFPKKAEKEGEKKEEEGQ